MASVAGPSPYKFLDYYDVADRSLFFGREREARRLLTDVVVGRLVVLFAETGTGKTSLINAGVRPLLDERGYDTFFVRVRRDPVQSARDELTLATGLTLPDAPLSEQLRYVATDGGKPIVVFFDQFEEFFQYAGKDEETARAFVDDVARVYSDEEAGIHLVFSMREEWFAKMDVFRDRIPTIFHKDSSLRLRWFDREQARDAIVLPARTRKVEIERELEQRLLSDLEENGRIEPAQLQIVCDTLWSKREDGAITLAQYTALGAEGGNVAVQILEWRVEEELKDLPKEQLDVLSRLLPQLGSGEDTKTLLPVEGLAAALGAEQTVLDDLLEQLEHARLIRRNPLDRNRDFVELTHDYLVERLGALQLRVEAIWPRRMLDAAGERFRASGELLEAAELTDIVDRLDQLSPGPEGAELLFRSAVRRGVHMARTFRHASGAAVDVQAIAREQIAIGGDEAFNVIDLLAELASEDTYSLLADALLNDEVGGRVVEVLGRIESAAAVTMLADVLARDGLESPAATALVKLTRSKDASVANAAADAVVAVARERLPAADLDPAVVLLGQMETVGSVELLRDLLDREEISDAAQDALVSLTRAKPPAVAARATEIVVDFLGGRLQRGDSAPAAARLGRVERLEAIELLASALGREQSGLEAREALVTLTGSPDRDVAAAAAHALVHALPLDASTVEVLGRIDAVAAVDCLADALKQRHLYGEARQALTRHAESKRPDVAGRARQVLAKETERPRPAPRPPLPAGDPGSSSLAAQQRSVLDALFSGRLVPFLGAGVNLAERPAGESWAQARYLPTGYELAEYLARSSRYPSEEVRDLSRVAQFVEFTEGSGSLNGRLRELFAAEYAPSAVHRFLASVPSAIRARTGQQSPLLIATTNYDDTLERAFASAGEPVDVLWYATRGEERGKFWHRPPSGDARLVETPSRYRDVDPSARPVILKLYGSVDPQERDRDSFVITEDDYVDYLAGANLAEAIPVTVAARLRRSSFLFLGYSMSDWNLRVILNRMWGHQTQAYSSWAVQRTSGEIERASWARYGVDILEYDLHDYVGALRDALEGQSEEVLR